MGSGGLGSRDPQTGSAWMGVMGQGTARDAPPVAGFSPPEGRFPGRWGNRPQNVRSSGGCLLLEKGLMGVEEGSQGQKSDSQGLLSAVSVCPSPGL